MVIKCVSTAASLAGYRQVFFHQFISLINENILLLFLWNEERADELVYLRSVFENLLYKKLEC